MTFDTCRTPFFRAYSEQVAGSGYIISRPKGTHVVSFGWALLACAKQQFVQMQYRPCPVDSFFGEVFQLTSEGTGMGHSLNLGVRKYAILLEGTSRQPK